MWKRGGSQVRSIHFKMKLITDIKEMQRYSKEARGSGKAIAFVPTMGYLHEGHLSLLKEGRKRADLLVMSIFVNPTQFGPGEDYASYPRDMRRDMEMAEGVGVDVVFNPDVRDIYPEGFQTYVRVEEVTKNLCGLSRPGHFQGVATVVLKLFNIVRPHIAIFGEKDFQQLVMVKRMIKDLNMDIEIIGMPTVREGDGLAMSSRNSYLSPAERKAGQAIYRSLLRGKEVFDKGIIDVDKILGEVRKVVEGEPLIVVEYIKLCDMNTLQDINIVEGEALLAIAVRVGKARLIDNIKLGYR